MDVDVHAAVQCFLSDSHRDTKSTALHACLQGGATRGDVEGFFGARRTLEDLLAFLRVYHPHRPTLPLDMRVHILHLAKNPFLTTASVSIVIATHEEDAGLYRELPSSLAYVLRRMGEQQTITLPSGWELRPRSVGRDLAQQYRTQAGAAECIWLTAVVIAFQYAGMGHYQVMGFDRTARVFFTLLDGGANGWDREANFRQAATQTKDSIHAVGWKLLLSPP